MSIEDKIKNAKESTWLTEGLTKEEVKEIVETAKQEAREEMTQAINYKHSSSFSVNVDDAYINEDILRRMSMIKCNKCGKEFEFGNTDGVPNGVGIELQDGTVLNLCHECIIRFNHLETDEERRQFFRDMGYKGEFMQ